MDMEEIRNIDEQIKENEEQIDRLSKEILNNINKIIQDNQDLLKEMYKIGVYSLQGRDGIFAIKDGLVINEVTEVDRAIILNVKDGCVFEYRDIIDNKGKRMIRNVNIRRLTDGAILECIQEGYITPKMIEDRINDYTNRLKEYEQKQKKKIANLNKLI